MKRHLFHVLVLETNPTDSSNVASEIEIAEPAAIPSEPTSNVEFHSELTSTCHMPMPPRRNYQQTEATNILDNKALNRPSTSSSSVFLPELMRPYPKASPRKMQTRRRTKKSAIYTATPEK